MTDLISEAIELHNICSPKWCFLGGEDVGFINKTSVFMTTTVPMPEKGSCTGLGQNP